jgi:hypothetical protein
MEINRSRRYIANLIEVERKKILELKREEKKFGEKLVGLQN